MIIVFVEAASAAILVLHWVLAATDRWLRLRQSLAIALGAFVGEEICVRLEGAYRYSPLWHLRVDAIPLAVLLIWPSVVLSSWTLASGVAPGARRWVHRALLTGAFTWLDATLVEPVASHAGLWTWAVPGPFDVSWVGPFGWGAYAFAAGLWLERKSLVALVGVAPAVAQMLILAAYWSVGRWLGQPSPTLALVIDLIPAAAGTCAALSWRKHFRLPWSEIVPRAAAALLFVSLVALRFSFPLALLTLGVAVPYLLLLPSLASHSRATRSGQSVVAPAVKVRMSDG